MKLGISILLLFLLFLWIDIITSQQLIIVRNKTLELKDELLLFSAKRIENLNEIKYDSLIYLIRRFNLSGISIFNKNKEMILSIGEQDARLEFFPDSFIFYGLRKIVYNTDKNYILIGSNDDELKSLRNSFITIMFLKILFYLNFFFIAFLIFKRKGVKKEIIESQDNYLIETLKERINNLSSENRELKRFREEIESQKYLFEIGRNLSTILHEIRNSSGTIIGYSKLLKDKDIGSRILEEAFLLNRISDSLLFLSKPVYLKKENVNLKSLLLSIYVPERIEYLVKCKEDIYIDVDRDLFKKAIENIIQNSLNAIEKNGKITVDVKKDDKVYITIKDNGKGMDEEELSRCFEMFYSGEKRGTGIGLWFVKKIIEAHNGAISVSSEKGKGTKFKIVL